MYATNTSLRDNNNSKIAIILTQFKHTGYTIFQLFAYVSVGLIF